MSRIQKHQGQRLPRDHAVDGRASQAVRGRSYRRSLVFIGSSVSRNFRHLACPDSTCIHSIFYIICYVIYLIHDLWYTISSTRYVIVCIHIYICMHILHWFAYIYIINITWSNYIQPYGHLRCWQSSQSCRKWSQKSSEPRPSASTRVQWTTTGSTNGWSLNTGRFDNFDPQPLVTIGWGVWYAHSSFAMDLGYLQGIEHESECRISVRMDGMNSEIWSGEIGFCKNGTGCSSMYKRFPEKRTLQLKSVRHTAFNIHAGLCGPAPHVVNVARSFEIFCVTGIQTRIRRRRPDVFPANPSKQPTLCRRQICILRSPWILFVHWFINGWSAWRERLRTWQQLFSSSSRRGRACWTSSEEVTRVTSGDSGGNSPFSTIHWVSLSTCYLEPSMNATLCLLGL